MDNGFKWPDADDKDLVIVCATIIAIMSMFFLGSDGGTTIVGNVITGLFGVAVGNAMKG